MLFSPSLRAFPRPRARYERHSGHEKHACVSAHTYRARARSGAHECRLVRASQPRSKASAEASGDYDLGRRFIVFASVTSFNFTCLFVSSNAQATSNALVSDAWSALGGGDADLVFPSSFVGNWIARATTASVEAPLGEEFIRDKLAFDRERAEIGKEFVYPVRFIANKRGDCVFDRAFNVRAIAEASRGGGRRVLDGEIEWDVNDPNVLKLNTSDGASVYYRVQARSMESDADARRVTTSELAQIVVDRANVGGEPKVKSTRVVTKYKYRTAEEAKGGAQIVAVQTIYEYLTSFDDDEKFARAMGKPVQVSVYKLELVPYDYDSMK